MEPYFVFSMKSIHHIVDDHLIILSIWSSIYCFGMVWHNAPRKIAETCHCVKKKELRLPLPELQTGIGSKLFWSTCKIFEYSLREFLVVVIVVQVIYDPDDLCSLLAFYVPKRLTGITYTFELQMWLWVDRFLRCRFQPSWPHPFQIAYLHMQPHWNLRNNAELFPGAAKLYLTVPYQNPYQANSELLGWFPWCSPIRSLTFGVMDVSSACTTRFGKSSKKSQQVNLLGNFWGQKIQRSQELVTFATYWITLLRWNGMRCSGGCLDEMSKKLTSRVRLRIIIIVDHDSSEYIESTY